MFIEYDLTPNLPALTLTIEIRLYRLEDDTTPVATETVILKATDGVRPVSARLSRNAGQSDVARALYDYLQEVEDATKNLIRLYTELEPYDGVRVDMAALGAFIGGRG